MLTRACIRDWQGLAPGHCWSSHIPRRREPDGRNLAWRGFSFSAYKIRLLVRHARTLKWFAGYAESNNSYLRVENEDGALSKRSVWSNGVEASVGVSHDESFAVGSILNGSPIVKHFLDYDERDVTAVEPAEIVSCNCVSRFKRSNSTYFNSEDAGVVSLDCLREDGQDILTKNGHRMAVTAPSTELDLDDFEYYVPEIGHNILGVVVSGNRTKFDVDIGAVKLAELKVSKLFPLDRFQVKHNKWICPEEVDADGAKFSKPPHGCPCMVYDEEVFAYEDPALFVIDIGTVLELVVIGISSSDIAILSARKAAERIAWDRVKQIKELNQPIQVEVIDCNTSGVLAKVEGLRAFLPLKEFIKRPKILEDNVGRKLWVMIIFADKDCHNLVISERKAWVKRNLQPGSLHDGTVIGFLPYGIRVQVNRTNIMGLIHVSNIAHALIEKVADVFDVGEQIKMMVVNSSALNKISFSTADLESEQGLMLRDKQRVFQEAERKAHAWRVANRRSKESQNSDAEDLSSQVALEPIANLDWLDFAKNRVPCA